MKPPRQLVILSLLAGLAAVPATAETLLFAPRVESQQKTELQYDVPDGCVITGLGFRAAYDNITTMFARYHRLAPDGKLVDPHNILIGSEPNHACEAKVLLPDGWLAVGFGAAGEPEWDVTLLRIWARPLNKDGTLGEIRIFNDGFKPDREPERSVLLADSDRALTGAGLRFASNDIGGIYARSAQVLNLTDKDREQIAAFKTRAWLLRGGLGASPELAEAARRHGVTRLDIVHPADPLALPPRDRFESHIWLDAALLPRLPQLLDGSADFSGIVLDLAHLPPEAAEPNAVRNLLRICRSRKLLLSLRLDPRENPLSPHNRELLAQLPPDISLVVPLYDKRVFKPNDAPLDFTHFAPRGIIVQFDLIRQSMGRSRIPDVRIDELPSLIVESALAGAAGFITQVNLLDRELLDGVNAPSLGALTSLADDPFQPADALWTRFCSEVYGPAAQLAAASLRRTAAVNDLIYRTFDYSILWNDGTIPALPELDAMIRHRPHILALPEKDPVRSALLDPDDKAVELASREKETALWLLRQSVRDANQARDLHPSPQTRRLAEAMTRLDNAALFWHNATQAFFLAKRYAVDGAPVTRAAALTAIDSLETPAADNRDRILLYAGADRFARSVRDSLARSDQNAELPLALRRAAALDREGRPDEAAAALRRTITSPRFAPHIDRQNDLVSAVASALGALGGPSPHITLMRHGDGRWLIEKVAARWAVRIGDKSPCLYLDFPAGPLPAPADYVISFEYLDAGDWNLHFEYDSDYPPEQKRQYHPVEPLPLTDTGTWKTGSFTLTKCLFNSGQNALADMRFVSGRTVFLRNIRLEPRKVPRP